MEKAISQKNTYNCTEKHTQTSRGTKYILNLNWTFSQAFRWGNAKQNPKIWEMKNKSEKMIYFLWKQIFYKDFIPNHMW